MTKGQFRVYVSIEREIKSLVSELAQVSAPKTRGDYIRLIRAAIELLPARPPNYEQWAAEHDLPAA